MSVKSKLLITAAAFIVVGALMVAFLDTKGPEPSFVCVTDGGATSGFTDSSQGNCPVSIESYNKWANWYSSPQIGKIAGLGIVVVGIVVGIVGIVKRSKPRV
jgi:hypothetical protein